MLAMSALSFAARHSIPRLSTPNGHLKFLFSDTKDNDTIAAIVGAAVGALHGRSALPERWIAGLTGRTSNESGRVDDGRIFELIEQARRRFWK
jgi:hypothetical protein